MSAVAVLGPGSWGTTLANLLAFNAVSTLPTRNFTAATFEGAPRLAAEELQEMRLRAGDAGDLLQVEHRAVAVHDAAARIPSAHVSTEWLRATRSRSTCPTTNPITTPMLKTVQIPT